MLKVENGSKLAIVSENCESDWFSLILSRNSSQSYVGLESF